MRKSTWPYNTAIKAEKEEKNRERREKQKEREAERGGDNHRILIRYTYLVTLKSKVYLHTRVYPGKRKILDPANTIPGTWHPDAIEIQGSSRDLNSESEATT